MKTHQYHTIGARRNPADIVVIRSDNGRESLAIVPSEQEKVHEATGIDMTFSKLDAGVFAKLRFYVNSVRKAEFELQRNDVKEWTTFACREEWRKEPDDCVESARTLKIINSLTGDSVELLAEDNCIESEDVVLGVEDESWAKKLADCGDDELTLLPDEWEAFFAECDGLVLEDSNGPRKPEGFEKDLFLALASLVELHDGLDGGNGIITATDWEEVRALLAKVKAEVAL